MKLTEISPSQWEDHLNKEVLVYHTEKKKYAVGTIMQKEDDIYCWFSSITSKDSIIWMEPFVLTYLIEREPVDTI